MLLLLLDEMNLARIEYYFSDFLSRLEQRRGRKIEDPQRRREVSLLVDGQLREFPFDPLVDCARIDPDVLCDLLD